MASPVCPRATQASASGGSSRPACHLRRVQQPRQCPLEVRRRKLIDVKHLEVREGLFDVASQIQQFTDADAAAHHGVPVRLRGEQDRLCETIRV